MNYNNVCNYEYPQDNNGFKQPKSVEAVGEQWQSEVCHCLPKNRAELERLRMLYESLPCIYFTLNSTELILSFSQFGATYLGYDAAELIEKSVSEIFYWEDRAKCQAKLTEVQHQLPQMSQWEARLVCKNGKSLWVKAIARSLPGTESNPLISLVCQDITEYKQLDEHRQYRHHLECQVTECSPELWRANQQLQQEISDRQQTEAALRMTQARIQHLLSSSPVVIYSSKPSGDYAATFISENITSQLGYQAEDFLTDSRFWSDRIHPDDTALILAELENLFEKGYLTYEYRFLHKDGTYRWMRDEMRLVGDVEGQAVEIVGSWQDITERKQAEEILQESEERFRTLADSAPVLLWMSDTDGLCTFFNQSWLNFTGRPLEKETGDGWTQAVHPDDWQFCINTYLAAFNARQEFRMEYRLQRADGEYRWVLNTGIPRFTSSGNFVGYIGSCVDITDRRQAEDAMQHQFLRERLMGAIAHRIHKSLNLEEILHTTVAEVRQFLVCDRVIIFQLLEDGSGVVVVESVDPDWVPISGISINDRYFAQDYIELYRQGRVQAVEDIYTASLTPCHAELLAQFQVKANLVVPIVHEEKLWGLLVAQQCSQTRKWQPLEIDLLKSLATQAAVAIHQSELYQQAQAEIAQRQQAEAALRQQFQRGELVGAIAQRIRQSLKLEEILNATVAEVRQFLGCDRVLIYRVWPNRTGSAVTEAVVPGWPAILGQTFPEEVFPQESQKLYSQGRILAIDDVDQAEVLPCLAEFVQQFGVKAKLVVPILQEKALWGLLIAHHCSSPRHWQLAERDLLQSLATQVAIALQQSQLYEQAQSQAKRERALNQVTQAIRSSLDLKTIFETAVCQIGELLQVDHAKIVQYLPERNCWLHVSEYCQSKEAPSCVGGEIPDENNLIAERLKRLEIVRIQDTSTLDDEINEDLAEALPGAWLLVPLHFGFRVFGSLTLGRDIYPYHWQDSEVELIRAVADQLAIALQQAELYQQSRTATATALEKAEQLEQALQELQRTQAHLVQSEKMSSLGQLVAGVAHEINNPVSFIYGNLMHADGYTQDILDLLDLYQQHYPNPVPEIQSEIDGIDLDFLIEDLPKLLDSMKVGAERICEIVSSLRNFSRVSEAEIKAVDIHQGLDSTLTILQNRLKAQGKRPGIEVIKEYGKVPPVECYAGQLNQVFMNLLSNAIDALEESVVSEKTDDRVGDSGVGTVCSDSDRIDAPTAQPTKDGQLTTNKKPLIRICTELLNNSEVVIRIADNGLGMAEHVRQRIFDPFFTTKPVGVGTGLGLSISYQIVIEKHGGQLHCFSERGQGTEFVIQIPLLQSGRASVK